MPILSPAGPKGVSSLICVREGAVEGSAAKAAGDKPHAVTHNATSPDKNFETIVTSKRIAHPVVLPDARKCCGHIQRPGGFKSHYRAGRIRTGLQLVEEVNDLLPCIFGVVHCDLVAFLQGIARALHDAVIGLDDRLLS